MTQDVKDANHQALWDAADVRERTPGVEQTVAREIMHGRMAAAR